MSWNDDKYSAIEHEMGESTASIVAQSQAAAIDFLEQVRCFTVIPATDHVFALSCSSSNSSMVSHVSCHSTLYGVRA